MTLEPTEFSGDESLEQALAGGTPARVGWFRYYFDEQRWEWSPQVAQMHGYTPDEVNPTTELVLSHKHPDDQVQVAATLDVIRCSPRPFSTRHRIVAVGGDVRHVVMVGDRLDDDDGAIIGAQGFYVDVTPVIEQAQEEVVTEAVAEIAEARGPIEQAKGMLMLIYRIGADSAFELLRWRSQETNVKLRLIAEQLATDFVSLDYDDTLPERVVFDRLLLTAHLRVAT